MAEQIDLRNPFIESLACSTLNPGLRSILIFDALPDTLRATTQILRPMLKIITGAEVISVRLGSFETEDDLWGHLGLWNEQEQQSLGWQAGLLTGRYSEKELRIVVIQDLTKLSLAAMRACVMLIGANVAHLERQGKQVRWTPNLFWLAGCASEEIGTISPHLLDRFALRLSGQLSKSSNRVEEILNWLNKPTQTQQDPLLSVHQEIELESNIKKQLLKAAKNRPKFTSEAAARILDYTSELQEYSLRREIALARLSLANAQLEDKAQVTKKNVDIAASLFGFKVSRRQTEKLSETKLSNTKYQSDSVQSKIIEENSPQPSSEIIPSNQSDFSRPIEPVFQSNQSDTFEDIVIPTEVNTRFNPYPEDQAPIERELNSLKLPTVRFCAKTVARGKIIGVEKTTIPQDLAIVRTLLEAAKFQNIRQGKKEDGWGLLKLSPTDLFSYRRAPVAEKMLILVLDHTCLSNCYWQQKLMPYLSWSYVERASVCLIQVGAAVTSHPLKAEKIMAKTILSPSIGAGIEIGRGRATPLAHGLDLAKQTLRHALQRGRNRIHQALLVVISDGRGNVPLKASQTGDIKPYLPVGRKGIEDALQVAEQIKGISNLEVVMLNPQPREYPKLPLLLAKALGAQVILIPPQENWEVEQW